MEKELTITDAHSDNKPRQEMVVQLNGGSPWYGYIWLDDEMYEIIYDDEEEIFKLKHKA